jgi:pimeloyl-ACP methyl ester carboxylesterase
VTVAITGLRSPLYVERRGAGQALVMLHGGGGEIDDLVALRDLLQPGRRIISPDQRGHGRSPGDGVISYAAQAAETAALLDELGDGPFDVLGWSDGGIVSLLLARDRPDLIRRVIAISANASLSTVPAAYSDASMAWFSEPENAQELTTPESRRSLDPEGAEWPGIAARILAMWRDGPDLELASLARITAPVLFIAGDRDAIQPEHTLAMFRATPGAELAIVPRATHQLVTTHVSEVAGIVEMFLGG